ncbi:hypothetical protein DEO72_LG7g2371 [Vigna unguiculata]|uniref:Uncharacterized protein n=1 Tax=Vigna unguiculata TaxID=3917 RepID=A0A4D6MLS2_VIGUN|nr:hypothetical protein DEO72_LG7g2371 [Vigna unguiculata]
MLAVPLTAIVEYLDWEETTTMLDVSPYDPRKWKDFGPRANKLREAEDRSHLRHKRNMLTRLIFDEECPMPNKRVFNDEHVIKMFVKVEGHKDLARAIFSTNLTDQQAQSWMEKVVEVVATKHPSYMIGQEIDVRVARVVELTKPPSSYDMMALYYSFDISGWSTKMSVEPHHISHQIWAKLYGGHLFSSTMNAARERQIVLDALISSTSAILFAYIDDMLSRIDLPKKYATEAFSLYKSVVIETFDACELSIEVSKCFASGRFVIFLNEVYLVDLHVAHGVRAAMGISIEPTERHTSLIERVTSVATRCRGAFITTFKNNSKYAELLFVYLDVAYKEPIPLTVSEVLCAFEWRFKGGTPSEIVWLDGNKVKALNRILARRSKAQQMHSKAQLAQVGKLQMLLSNYGLPQAPRKISLVKRLVGIMSLVEAKTLARRVGQRVRELWSQDRVEEGKSATNQKGESGGSNVGGQAKEVRLEQVRHEATAPAGNVRNLCICGSFLPGRSRNDTLESTGAQGGRSGGGQHRTDSAFLRARA